MHILIFFFNDTATTEIYTLSLHDALPIFLDGTAPALRGPGGRHSGQSDRLAVIRLARPLAVGGPRGAAAAPRSEEHTSELQSRQYLVCRLLLEKKKHKARIPMSTQTTSHR